MASPFFSIGITTYDRPALLREAIDSVLAQDFTDFEIIVGNDYQAQELSGTLLGIDDARVRIVNHPRNLREIGNMNALLERASGRYFTWLFDDDLYAPGFLRTAFEVLTRTAFPPVLFPSYRVCRGMDAGSVAAVSCRNFQVFDGRRYLRNYFSGAARLISTCGLFDLEALRQVVGGVAELSSSPVGLYSEYEFLVRCARFERIVYMDVPGVIFRAHGGSWGETNRALPIYLEAGEALLRRSAEVLRQPELETDFARNLLGVYKIHLSTFSHAVVRVERAGGAAGPAVLLRSWRQLLREHARLLPVLKQAGREQVRQLGFRTLPLVAKGFYLVGFAMLYYAWRQWKEGRDGR